MDEVRLLFPVDKIHFNLSILVNGNQEAWGQKNVGQKDGCQKKIP